MPTLFNRTVRYYTARPTGQVVKLEGPPPAPASPAFSAAQMGLTVMGSLLTATLMMLVMGSSAARFVMFAVVSAVVGVVTGSVMYVLNRKKYVAAMEKRSADYAAYLDGKGRELEALRETQGQAELTDHPELKDVAVWIERRGERLWQKSARGADFLSVRLGRGQVAPAFSVEAPRASEIGALDPLLAAAQALVSATQQPLDAPVSLALGSVWSAGICGPRGYALSAARAVWLQLAAHYAPSEVGLAVIGESAERAEWDWARWLPHVWDDNRTARRIADNTFEGAQVVTEILQGLNAARTWVVLLTRPWAVERQVLDHLLASDTARVLLVADGPHQLPPGMAAVVEVRERGSSLRLMEAGSRAIEFAPDGLDAGNADRLARLLAGVREGGQAGNSSIPTAVTLTETLGWEPQPVAVALRWKEAQPWRSLAVPVGLGAGGVKVTLDLHERGDGPHGLMAGTTGSGKSEFLQSLILSLACHFGPDELGFLLVDFKGGGMLEAFRELPHLLGALTNLDESLATRAMLALGGELRRRQRLFAEAGVNHIDDYQKKRREDSKRTALPRGELARPIRATGLPRLVIIVDEFAELAKARPEFMAELISVARVGRSLGVYLILATQKPAGVVNEQIWSNSNYRVCLRVGQTQDSQDILKQPDAAHLPRTSPGRAYLDVGATHDKFILFQSAFSGAPYRRGGTAAAERAMYEVALSGQRRLRKAGGPGGTGPLESQLVVVNKRLAQAARLGEIKPPEPVWLEPLPEKIILSDVPRLESKRLCAEAPPLALRLPAGQTTGWPFHGVVGLTDDPANQRQAALRLELDTAHLMVIGGPGSGKTTLLQTLIVSLAEQYPPSTASIYSLDFGSRLLRQFESLPHVGAVIVPGEEDRLERLFHWLGLELEERQTALAEAGVATFGAYRETEGPNKPHIVLLIDNLPELNGQWPEAPEHLLRLTRDGASLGIHVVVTASSGSGVPYRLAANFGMALALELPDAGDYAGVVGRTGGLTPTRVRGRCLVKGEPVLEAQIALPVSGASEAARAQALRTHLQTLAALYVGHMAAKAIRARPERVTLEELLPATRPNGLTLPRGTISSPSTGDKIATGLRGPAGLDYKTLETVWADLSGHVLVLNANGGEALLQTLVAGLAALNPPTLWPMVLVSRRGTLKACAGWPHVAQTLNNEAEFITWAQARAGEAAARREAISAVTQSVNPEQTVSAGQQFHGLTLVIDDYDALSKAETGALEGLLKAGYPGLRVLAACSAVKAQSALDRAMVTLRESGVGLALGSDAVSALGVRLPVGARLPPGVGFYVTRTGAQMLIPAGVDLEQFKVPSFELSVQGSEFKVQR